MKHWVVGLFIFLMMVTVGCGTETQEESLITSNQELTQTFAPGSYVIPMDTTFQDQGTLKAFGLVYRLLSNGIPVHWIVDETKIAGGSDFTATTIDIQSLATQTHGYRGGPFVVDSADATEAFPIIESWHTDGHVTTVHESTAAFDANVSRTLVSAPNIGVFQDDNEVIGFRYLNAAGIPDSLGQAWPNATSSSYPASPDVLSETELAGVDGVNDGILLDSDGVPTFCQLTSMHYDSTNVNDEVVREVRRWLEATPSTHAFMECDSVDSFENNIHGQFLSTQGLSDAGVNPNPVIAQALGNPLVQLDGGFTSVSGSIRAFELSTGSSLHALAQALIVTQASPTTMVYLSGPVDGDVSNGRVTYLGGHEYSTGLPISVNPSTNGVRLFLNSLFESPCAQAEMQPNVSISISGPAQTSVAQVTYTIQVNNAGPGFARDVRVVAPIPAGGAFVGASVGGVQNAGSVEWDLGSLLAGEAVTLTLTVTLVPGTNSQEATAEWTVGITSNSASASEDTELLSGVPVTITSPASDSSINDSTPEISGTVALGATVAVEVRDSQGSLVFLGDAVVTGTAWSIESAVLVEGDYTVRVTAELGVETGVFGPISFGVDTTAPTVVLLAPADGTTVGSTPTVNGTVESGASVQVEIRDENNVVVSSGIATVSGTVFSRQVGVLAAGDYTVNATATDSAGNTATTPSHSFTVSIVGPTLMIRSPQDSSSVSSDTVEVSGFTTAAEVDVVVRDSSGNILAELTLIRNDDGDFLGEVQGLDDGEYTFEFTATDGDGTTSVTHTAKVDTIAPVTTITSPVEGTVTNDNTPTIEGTGEPGSTIEISLEEDVLGQVAVGEDGTWSFVVTQPLDDGEYTITVESSDAAGNQGESVVRDFVVSTRVPIVTISTPAPDQRFFNGAITVEGTADPGQEVDVFIDGVLFGTVTADSNGDWSIQISVADGVHVIEALAIDVAGNTGSSGTITFRFRRAADLVVTSPVDGVIVSGPTVTVSGQAEPDSQVTIVVDGKTVIVPVDSNGNWSATFDLLPGDRMFTISDEFGESTQITVEVESGVEPEPDPDPNPIDPGATYLEGGCAQAPGDAAPSGLLLLVLGWLGMRVRSRILF